VDKNRGNHIFLVLSLLVVVIGFSFLTGYDYSQPINSLRTSISHLSLSGGSSLTGAAIGVESEIGVQAGDCMGAYTGGSWTINSTISCSDDTINVNGNVTIVNTNPRVVTSFSSSASAADLRPYSGGISGGLDLVANEAAYSPNWDQARGDTFKIMMNESEHKIKFFFNSSLGDVIGIDLDNSASSGKDLGTGYGAEILVSNLPAMGLVGAAVYNSSLDGGEMGMGWFQLAPSGSQITTSYDSNLLANYTVEYNQSADNNTYEVIVTVNGSWVNKPINLLVPGQNSYYTTFMNADPNTIGERGNLTLNNVVLHVQNNFTANGILNVDHSLIYFDVNSSILSLGPNSNILINNTNITANDSSLRYGLLASGSSLTLENDYFDNTGVNTGVNNYGLNIEGTGGTLNNITVGPSQGMYTITVMGSGLSLLNSHFGTGSITMNGAFGNTIRGNTAAGVGILMSGMYNNLFDSNNFTNGYISLAGLGGGDVYNNTFLNNNFNGTSITNNNNTYSNYFIYNNSYGQIKWYRNNFSTSGGGVVFLLGQSGITLDPNLLGAVITDNTPNFNTTAELTFNGLLWNISAQLCNNISGTISGCVDCNVSNNCSYSNITGIMQVNVTHFSNYSTNGSIVVGQETPAANYLSNFTEDFADALNSSFFITQGVSASVGLSNGMLRINGSLVAEIDSRMGLIYTNHTVSNNSFIVSTFINISGSSIANNYTWIETGLILHNQSNTLIDSDVICDLAINNAGYYLYFYNETFNSENFIASTNQLTEYGGNLTLFYNATTGIYNCTFGTVSLASTIGGLNSQFSVGIFAEIGYDHDPATGVLDTLFDNWRFTNGSTTHPVTQESPAMTYLSNFFDTFSGSTINTSMYINTTVGNTSLSQNDKLIMNGTDGFGIFETKSLVNVSNNFTLSVKVNKFDNTTYGILGGDNDPTAFILQVGNASGSLEYSKCRIYFGVDTYVLQSGGMTGGQSWNTSVTYAENQTLSMVYNANHSYTCTYNGQTVYGINSSSSSGNYLLELIGVPTTSRMNLQFDDLNLTYGTASGGESSPSNNVSANLISPANGTWTSYGNIAFGSMAVLNFTFNQTGLGNNANCTMLVLGVGPVGSTLLNENVNWILSLSGVPENTYYWNVSCFNSSGSVATSENRFLGVDYTAPQINITSPANGSSVSSASAVAGTITDAGAGVNNGGNPPSFAIAKGNGADAGKYYNWSGGGGDWVSGGSFFDFTIVATYNSTTHAFNVTLPSLTAGMYNLTTLAADLVTYGLDPMYSTSGNVRRVDTYFILSSAVDTQYPSVTLVSPSSGTYTNANNNTLPFVFGYQDGDLTANCTLYLNGVASGNNVSVQNNTNTNIYANTAFTEGSNSWYVNCTDAAGNTNKSTSTYTFIADTTNPTSTLTSINDKSSGQWTNSQSLSINMVARDNYISAWNISIYNLTGLVSYNVVSGTNLSGTFSTSVSADGNYTVNLTVVDLVNNTNTSTFNILVDTAAPTVSLAGPPNNTIVKLPSLSSTFNFTDSLSSTANCSLYVGGTARTTNSSVFSSTNTALTYGSLSEGNNSWYVSCTDLASNVGTSEVRNIQLDTTNPSVSGASVNVSRAKSSTMVGINVTVIDANLDWVKANNVNMSSGGNNIYNLSAAASTLGCSEGTCTISITANDSKGNINTSVTTSYVIDDSAPGFLTNTTTPDSGSMYNTSLTYYFNVSWNESGTISTALLEFNGANYSMTSAGSGAYYKTLTGLAAGTYNYKFIAIDDLGNANSTSQYSYIVAQATPVITALLNGTAANLTLAYPNTVNASGSTDAGTLTIYRDGTAITNGAASLLAVSYYRYDFNVTGNQNYTNTSTTLFANVTVGTPSLHLYFNGVEGNLSTTYGTKINVTGTGSDTQLTYNLYKNGTSITNPEILSNRSYGTNYTYIFNTSGNANYSVANASYVLEVLLGTGQDLTDSTNITVTNTTTEIVLQNSSLSQILLNSSIVSTTPVNISFGLLLDPSTGSVSLGANNFTMSREVAGTTYTLDIPANTTLTGGSAWDGKFTLPTLGTPSSFTAPSGSADLVVIAGSNVEINLSAPAKMVLTGMAGKSAAWSRAGTLTAIDTTCDDPLTPTNINRTTDPRICAITSGSDLIVWTYHFTNFAAYTPSSGTSSSSSGSGGGGGSTTPTVASPTYATENPAPKLSPVTKPAETPQAAPIEVPVSAAPTEVPAPVEEKKALAGMAISDQLKAILSDWTTLWIGLVVVVLIALSLYPVFRKLKKNRNREEMREELRRKAGKK